VVLFDEIEKAHPEVFHALLQVLDDGRLTDGQGRTVSFKNAVIIMTSNIGSGEIREMGPIGFSVHARSQGTQDEVRKTLLDLLRKAFRPEFLNRIDDIIVFNPLSKEHLGEIIGLQLKRVTEMLRKRGITLALTDKARDLIMAEGYDPAYGARPMRRAVQRLVQDPLAMKLLSGDLIAGDHVLADAEGKQLKFEKREAPAEEGVLSSMESAS